MSNTSSLTKDFSTQKAKDDSTSKMWENIEFNRNGLLVVVLGLVGCIGGLAAACGVQLGIGYLLAVVLPAMIALSTVLAVSPMKWVFGATAVALLVDFTMFLLFALN